jgi:hypothetical protein
MRRWAYIERLNAIAVANLLQTLTARLILSILATNAEMVELVDTLASGASGGNPVEVRVLFSAPKIIFYDN